jgi:micrococcal nuclease
MIFDRYIYDAKITDIVDGDTVIAHIDLGFRISREMILRLNRIDTPELRGATKDAGNASKDFVAKHALGKQVTIRTNKDKQEKYGRYLADIYIENDVGVIDCLNDLLVRHGHAIYRDY